MEDERIIELYNARNEQAIAETDRKYGASCRRLSENITRDPQDAEECVNDTYLAAWNTIPPTHPNPLSAFLFRITRNLSLKRYRHNIADRRDSRANIPLEELSECLGEADDLAGESATLARIIEAFLDELSQENRVIFLRRYWFSDSYAAISERVGLSEKVISMRLLRMREKLRTHLGKEGFPV